MSSGLRGTDATQDSVRRNSVERTVCNGRLTKQRFKDKEALSIKSTKFPKSFDTKVCHVFPQRLTLPTEGTAELIPQVDLRKVNIAVLRPWIAKKVTEMIKFEDDVVVEYVFGMLEDKETPVSPVFILSTKLNTMWYLSLPRCPTRGRCRSTCTDSWINTALRISLNLCGTSSSRLRIPSAECLLR